MEKKYFFKKKKNACVYQFSLNSVLKRSTSCTWLYRFQTEAPVPVDCVALTAFLFANQETDQWRRWDHKSRRVGSDIDQLKLAVYLVFARGGIGMKEPVHKSISSRHEDCNQEPAFEVERKVVRRRNRTTKMIRGKIYPPRLNATKRHEWASKRPDRLYSNCPIKWNELL